MITCGNAVVTYTGDDHWRLVSPLRATIDDVSIIVPAGFVTDLASIPRPLRPIRGSYELSLEAPIVHDYLYRRAGRLPGKTLSRKEADVIFLRLMEYKHVARRHRWLAYLAVRSVGWLYWP